MTERALTAEEEGRYRTILAGRGRDWNRRDWTSLDIAALLATLDAAREATAAAEQRLRKRIEALPRYARRGWQDGAGMAPSPNGSWVDRSDVLALLPRGQRLTGEAMTLVNDVCRDDCNSGCHRDDCEHHDFPAAAEPGAHKPGDNHDYRIECTVCGERGNVVLSVEPQRAGVTAVDLRLSDEQTAILRDHLASRQQTASEFFGDVLMEYGLGRATGKKYPPPDTALPTQASDSPENRDG